MNSIMQAISHGITTFAQGVHIAYTIAIYIACAISLYSIARNNQVKYSWIAFIPIVQYAIIGCLTEEYLLKGFRIKKLTVVLPLLFLLQIALEYFGGFWFFLPSLFLNAILALLLHKFFFLTDPKHALIFAFLCLFGKLPLTIILFFMRNKPQIMSAAAFPYPFGI
ncbi:MAG: hypothetical protein RSB38_05645 [Oscillospiraceae bacterium]